MDSVRIATRRGSERPIYITGLRLSGKTFMSTLLTMDSNIGIASLEVVKRPFVHCGDLRKKENARRCLDLMKSHFDSRGLTFDYQGITEQFENDDKSYLRLFELFFMDHARQVGRRRWGMHSSAFEFIVPSLLARHPLGRVIHLIRDPRDRQACLQMKRGGSFSRQSSKLIGREAARWDLSVERAERNQIRFPESFMIIRYEDLASVPRKTMDRVLSFLGEPVPTPQGQTATFRTEVRTTEIGCFETTLSARDKKIMEWLTGRTMRRLGYNSLTSGQGARVGPLRWDHWTQKIQYMLTRRKVGFEWNLLLSAGKQESLTANVIRSFRALARTSKIRVYSTINHAIHAKA